jgi:DnaJ-class molecular chaperone
MTEDDKKQTEMIDDIKTYLRMKDYYQILGVEKDADDTKIKNAYRRLAIRFHPDKNKLEGIFVTDLGAKQVFHKISNAYTTLIDKQSRESYDRYGPNE